MTYQEKVFFESVQNTRGVIKNKKKFEPIVCDILNFGSSEWIYEANILKRFGLQFICNVVMTFNKVQQKELLNNINKYNNPTIKLAKFEYDLLKAKYSIK